jgi:hypothetical protein
MSRPPGAKLDEFARLIARGFDPREASARAGYPDLRRSRARARLARPEVAARAPASPTPPPSPPSHPAVAAPAPRPALPPPMTEEEWLAEYAPHLLAEHRASA